MKNDSFQTAMEAIELLRKHSSGPHSDNLEILKLYLMEREGQDLGNFHISEELLASVSYVFEEAFLEETVGTAQEFITCYKFIKRLEDIYHPRLFNSPN